MRYGNSNISSRIESRGFTLTEVFIVVGLLGVLFSLALPQYRTYLQRGQRVEAVRMLTTAAACQERHRASAGTYDTNLCISISDNEHYRLSIEPTASTSSDIYVLIADPIELAGNENCGSLSLDQAGTRAISGPAQNLWECWSGR